MKDLKWTSVKDGLPEESGEYFCVRYKMPYKPEIMSFNNGYEEHCDNSEPHWYDQLGHMNGGGGGRKNYTDMTEDEKFFHDNYGKVTHWFTSPDRPDEE